MDMLRELALMGDDEAARCLNGILKGFVATNPDNEVLLRREDELFGFRLGARGL